MKQFLLQFGSGSPTLYAGLNPTFTVFYVLPGVGSTTPPGITQVPTNTGLYYFSYDPVSPIAFVVDGGTSILGAERYLAGQLDPVDKVDEQLTGVGNTLLAIGNSIYSMGQSNQVGTLIGNLSDSYGSTMTDPTTVFGFLKRLQEFNEGNSVFTKSSGLWQVYTRGSTYVLGPTTYPGLTAPLATKTISDSGSVITRS